MNKQDMLFLIKEKQKILTTNFKRLCLNDENDIYNYMYIAYIELINIIEHLPDGFCFKISKEFLVNENLVKMEKDPLYDIHITRVTNENPVCHVYIHSIKLK